MVATDAAIKKLEDAPVTEESPEKSGPSALRLDDGVCRPDRRRTSAAELLSFAALVLARVDQDVPSARPAGRGELVAAGHRHLMTSLSPLGADFFVLAGPAHGLARLHRLAWHDPLPKRDGVHVGAVCVDDPFPLRIR